jgi:hypothetical protein
MLEGLIIGCLITGFSAKPLFGKGLQELSQNEMNKLQKSYQQAYRRDFKKGRQPPLTIEQYLGKYQKSGRNSLIAGFVLLGIYIPLLLIMCATGLLDAFLAS